MKNIFNRENVILAIAGGIGIVLKSYVDEKRKKNTIAEEVKKYMEKK